MNNIHCLWRPWIRIWIVLFIRNYSNIRIIWIFVATLVTCIWYTHIPNFGSLAWFRRCKEHPCPLSTEEGLCRMLEVPDWSFRSWSWFGYGHLSLIHLFSKSCLSYSILNGKRTSMSFKSQFGPLEVVRGSWLVFTIVILIWIWSLVFDTSMIWILAIYLDFEGAKNIHVL